MLTVLIKLKESLFLRSVGPKSEQSHLRKEFQSKQCKYTFAQQQQIMLIKSRIKNAKQFWTTINKLTPHKKSMIPLQVYTDDGYLSDNLDIMYCINGSQINKCYIILV